MQSTPQLDVRHVQRLIIAAVVIFVGLFMGLQAIKEPMMATGLLAGFLLLFFLVLRPTYFCLLTFFFLFEAFDIVNVETFARLPGLFRAKDVLILLLVGFTVANLCMKAFPGGIMRSSRIFLPLLLFLIFVGLQMARTKFLLGESTMLMIRQGRHFLSYGAVFVLLLYFRREKDWRHLDIFCGIFVYVALVLNVLQAAGISLPIYMRSVNIDLRNVGALKSYNPAMVLTYWMFLRYFWRCALRPTLRNIRLLVLFGFPVVFFFFRSFLFATVVGVVVVALTCAERGPRTRALMTLVVGFLAAAVLNLLIITAVRSLNVSEILPVFRRYMVGTVTDVIEVGGTYASRVEIDRLRYPLVREHPILGIGFISVFGEIALQIWQMTGNLPVGTVDTGWVDIMLRLGGLGFLLLLMVLGYGFIVCRNLLRSTDLFSISEKATLMANASLFVLAPVSMVAANPLGYEPGIVVVAIALAWTMWLERKVRESKMERPQPAEASRRILAHGHAV